MPCASAAAAFGGGDGVGLVEQAAALGVADLGDRGADLGELGRGDLAGVRARREVETSCAPISTGVPANAERPAGIEVQWG